LRKGERVRLEERGPLWEVEAVNVCAATIRELHVQPKRVEFGDRSFTVTKGRRLHVSPTSFVYREV